MSAPRHGGPTVLYVNSALRESDWFIVPTSITTLMETLPAGCRRHGIFAWELTDELIRSASVVVLDCHWFTSLPETLGLVRWIRERRATVPIVLGGYTAQLFYRELLPLTGADYVIRGDNEQTFPLLMEALCHGRRDAARRLPNLAGRDFANPITYRFAPQDYGGLSFGIGWFPSYRRRIAMIDQGNCLDMDHEFYRYPLLVVSKGCVKDCAFCLGSTRCYSRLFDRGPVPIPAVQLERILRALEKDPDTPAVHLYFNWPVSDYTDFFSSRRFDLDLKSQIDVFPSVEDLKALAGAFRSSTFYLSLGHSVYDDRPEPGIDYRRYLDTFPGLRFFASRAQAEALRDAYGDRVLATTDTWRVPELFQGLQPCLERAIRSARRLLLDDPRAWAFRLILREHPAYRRRLLPALGVQEREVGLGGMRYSQAEYILHRNAC